MRKYSCLIVDDEPIAREIINNYCAHLSSLEVTGRCANALEARQAMLVRMPDILFLDINMPVLDGIAFLKTVKQPPQVIFTTAYKEYAVDAFDLAACDYLLKPFSLERFLVAVDKAIERLNAESSSNTNNNDDSVFIKTEGRVYKVPFDELLYAEACGNYSKVVTEKMVILTPMTFTALEELLPKQSFLRVHRSYILNKSKISYLEGNRVFINKKEIPVGGNYKDDFLSTLGL